MLKREKTAAFALVVLAAAAGAALAGDAPRLELSQKVLQPGQVVKVRMTGVAGQSVLRLVDPRGRILDKVGLAAAEGALTAPLRLASAVSPAAAVELVAGGEVVAREPVLVRTPERLGSGYLVVADAWGRRLTEGECRALGAAGVRAALTDDLESARRLAADGVSVVLGEPAAGLLRLGADDWARLQRTRSAVRPKCLHSPFVKLETTKALREFSARAAGLPLAGIIPVRGPSLGLAHEPHDLCRSENSLAAFREHLRRRYRSMSRLSEAWGAEQKRWSAVTPMSELGLRARIGPGALGPEETLAPWMEHRLFCDGALLSATAHAVSFLRRAFPRTPMVLLGAEVPGGYGPPGPAGLLREYEIAGSTLGPLPRLIAAAFSSERGRTLGVPDDPELGMLSGEVGVLASVDSLLAEGDRSAGLERAFDLQGGLGDLFAEATPARPPVSILISEESAKASYFLDRLLDASPAPRDQIKALTGTSYAEALVGWAELFDDLGVEYVLVDPAQICRGALRSGRTRVLVLARSISLSERCARAIGDFCRRGGVVLADAAPGVLDDAGRRRDLLDGLFGVTHGALEFAERGAHVVPIAGGVAAFLPRGSPARPAYPRGSLAGFPVAVKGVRVLGGSADAAADGVPCMISNSVGEGTAYYLNVAVSRYPHRRRISADGLRRVARFLVTSAGAGPRVEVRSADPDDLFAVRTWELGRLVIYGIWRRGPAAGPVEVTVRMPAAGHVAEPKRGLRYGLRREVDTVVPADGALILTASPVGERSVSLDLLASREPVDLEVKVHMTGGGRAGVRAVRVWAESPSGRRPSWYDRVLYVKGGPAAGHIPFCVSDERGPWKIRARDLASGRETFRTFVLR